MECTGILGAGTRDMQAGSIAMALYNKTMDDHWRFWGEGVYLASI